jgi:LURP-one-related
MAQLPPSEPLAVFQQFIARPNETIVLKERVMSLSGDSFSIKTTAGRPLMQVKAKKLSAHERKTVTDMRGNHLFTIRKKTFTVGSGTFYAEDPQGHKFFTLKGKWSGKKRPVDLHSATLLMQQKYSKAKTSELSKTR